MSEPRGFAGRERVRLWLSYQRYALLLSTGCATMIGATALLGTAWTWGWAGLVVVGPLSLRVGHFAVEVFRAHPRKLRATWAHQRRIDSQRFSPTALRAYCGDPCWRLVADEILTRAGLPADQRRDLIRTFADEIERDAHATVFVDHVNGTVRRSGAHGESLTFNHHNLASHPGHRADLASPSTDVLAS